jgi:hypothetical protein
VTFIDQSQQPVALTLVCSRLSGDSLLHPALAEALRQADIWRTSDRGYCFE